MDNFGTLNYNIAIMNQEMERRQTEFLVEIMEILIVSMRMRKAEESEMLARLHKAEDKHQIKITQGRNQAIDNLKMIKRLIDSAKEPPTGQLQSLAESLGKDPDPPKKTETPEKVPLQPGKKSASKKNK